MNVFHSCNGTNFHSAEDEILDCTWLRLVE